MLEALALATGLGGLGLLAYGIGHEARSLRLNRRRLVIPGWPAGLDGLRLAVLSDFHAGGPGYHPRRIDRAVKLTNEQAPDLVLLLGDFLDQRARPRGGVSPELVAAEVARLQARLGTFAVLGNHDLVHDRARVAAALGAAGVTVLENRAERVQAAGHPLWLAGTGDPHSRQDDLPATLAGIEDDAPVILLTHSPDLFPLVPEGVALTVAGHTHGGQVRIPWLGAPWIPGRIAWRYPAGLFRDGGRHFFVTRGLGHSALPLRLNAPPEVALLTLSGG